MLMGSSFGLRGRVAEEYSHPEPQLPDPIVELEIVFAAKVVAQSTSKTEYDGACIVDFVDRERRNYLIVAVGLHAYVSMPKGRHQ